jgi:hypothetical protein
MAATGTSDIDDSEEPLSRKIRRIAQVILRDIKLLLRDSLLVA